MSKNCHNIALPYFGLLGRVSFQNPLGMRPGDLHDPNPLYSVAVAIVNLQEPFQNLLSKSSFREPFELKLFLYLCTLQQLFYIFRLV